MSKFIPLLLIPVMHYLARTEGMVAIGAKMSHHGAGILEHLVLVPVLETKALGCVRIKTAHHAGPRRVADRYVTVGLQERRSTVRQTLDVRGLGLRMPSKAFNVIIKIITDDEQDIGLLLSKGPNGRKRKRIGYKQW